MILTKRVRINISTSVKNVVTPDFTIEHTAVFAEDELPIDLKQGVLEEASSLHQSLSSQYPTIKEEK